MIARMTFKFLSDWKSAVDAEYLTLQGDRRGGWGSARNAGCWPVQPGPVANIITGLSPPAPALPPALPTIHPCTRTSNPSHLINYLTSNNRERALYLWWIVDIKFFFIYIFLIWRFLHILHKDKGHQFHQIVLVNMRCECIGIQDILHRHIFISLYSSISRTDGLSVKVILTEQFNVCI